MRIKFPAITFILVLLFSSLPLQAKHITGNFYRLQIQTIIDNKQFDDNQKLDAIMEKYFLYELAQWPSNATYFGYNDYDDHWADLSQVAEDALMFHPDFPFSPGVRYLDAHGSECRLAGSFGTELGPSARPRSSPAAGQRSGCRRAASVGGCRDWSSRDAVVFSSATPLGHWSLHGCCPQHSRRCCRQQFAWPVRPSGRRRSQ